VSRVGDPTVHVPTAIPNTGNTEVQYLADVPDSWTFTVSFTTGPCMGSRTITLGNPTGKKAFYRLRALPPESLGLPLTDVDLTLTGGQPQKVDITLQPGMPFQAQLKSGGVGTPGEVRLIADVGPDAIATTNAQGAFSVAVQGSGLYSPLLIPQSAALAPHLGAKQQGALLAVAAYDVGAGESVAVSVTDPVASAVPDVRAVLRAGPLPSGGGTSNAAGAFTLHAEAKSYDTLSFGSDSWPQGTLANVTVPSGGTSIAIQYTIARVAVGGTVVASDGTTPVAGARVTVRSRPLGTIATVNVGGAGATAVGGRVARIVKTDGAGALPAMLLPAGTYDLLIEPPFPSADGLTAVTEVVAGATTWNLKVLPRITLAGRIIGDHGQAVPNARVTAVEMVGLGAAPSTVTDGAGQYSLVVDRGAPVTLLVEPGPDEHQAGTRVPLAAGTTAADVVLQPGLKVTGTVQVGTTALPAVTVQALCFSCGSLTPLAESITDGNGVYDIYLPDPGDNLVDGGTD
jgi:hypothetical protein